MGKNLIQQRRGRGTMRYRSPGFHFKGPSQYQYQPQQQAVVTELVHCAGHSAPLMELTSATNEKQLTIAPVGIAVGDVITMGQPTELKAGCILPLRDIPEGTAVYNIELSPGDGGKFVRSSGTTAQVLTKTDKGVVVKLPSKKEKIFPLDCRACIGVVAGGGRLEKPFLKAGAKHYKMKARNKLYPIVSGTSMNAVDHPFGGSKSTHKGRPTVAPKNAPPGRNVGKLHPRRTGKVN